MALMQCPECGGQVSNLAVACPHCGCPIQKTDQNEVASLPEHKETPPLKPADLPSGGRNYMSAPGEKKDHRTVATIISIIAILSAIAIAKTVSENTAKKAQSSERQSTYSSSISSGSSSKTHAHSSNSNYNSDEIKSGVYVLAEKCVKNHLKSPSSAVFCPMSECVFEKGTDGVYSMVGTVDSQNSFGAMLRETWVIMAEVDGEKVSLVMLQIGDQVYFE